jgi:sirohydrochlorin ferrochelatase
MIVALIDNGSLEPAAYRNLRAVAAALAARAGTQVHAVSWKHSDRLPAEALDHTPAWTLAPFVRAMVALGQREFVFIPFFISAQGAVGSTLRNDLEKLQGELGGFEFRFTDGLAARGALTGIIADRIRETIAARGLRTPLVVMVDHGGPSVASARLRDCIASELRILFGTSLDSLTAASMEGTHPPLLADQLRRPAFIVRDVVVAMLFLSPGRHAGPDGDVARLCLAARSDLPERSPPRCHLTALVGNHPTVVEVLAAALRDSLAKPRPWENERLSSVAGLPLVGTPLRLSPAAREGSPTLEISGQIAATPAGAGGYVS